MILISGNYLIIFNVNYRECPLLSKILKREYGVDLHPLKDSKNMCVQIYVAYGNLDAPHGIVCFDNPTMDSNDRLHSKFSDESGDKFDTVSQFVEDRLDSVGYLDNLRKRFTGTDLELLALSPYKRAALLFGWELGSERWADTAREYFESQGIYLTSDETADPVED